MRKLDRASGRRAARRGRSSRTCTGQRLTFLDLVDHLVSRGPGRRRSHASAPRGHELDELRPGVGERRPRADRARPAARGRRAASVDRRPARRRGRSTPDVRATAWPRSAAGNPLFVRQLRLDADRAGTCSAVRTAAGSRSATSTELEMPPTIHALLAARLDLLTREERAVLEPASVIGSRVPARRARRARARTCVRRAVGRAPRRARRSSTSSTASLGTTQTYALPPRPDPRRGLQRAAQADARRRCTSPFADWAEAREPRARPRDGVRGDPRLPPRAGAPVPRRARAAATNTAASSACALRSRLDLGRVGARSPATTWRQRRTCCAARSTCCRSGTSGGSGCCRTSARR